MSAHGLTGSTKASPGIKTGLLTSCVFFNTESPPGDLLQNSSCKRHYMPQVQCILVKFHALYSPFKCILALDTRHFYMEIKLIYKFIAIQILINNMHAFPAGTFILLLYESIPILSRYWTWNGLVEVTFNFTSPVPNV